MTRSAVSEATALAPATDIWRLGGLKMTAAVKFCGYSRYRLMDLCRDGELPHQRVGKGSGGGYIIARLALMRHMAKEAAKAERHATAQRESKADDDLCDGLTTSVVPS